MKRVERNGITTLAVDIRRGGQWRQTCYLAYPSGQRELVPLLGLRAWANACRRKVRA